MISYELAKRIRDAEFVSIGQAWNEDLKEILPVPTLEEAIEACGGRFTSLDKRSDGWKAIYHQNPDGYNFDALVPFVTASGKTPIEAVLNLWLKINTEKLT